MPAPNNIVYLKQQQVDRLKWDQCIDRAGNGLIYGFSGYLDQMADNWDALVLNDYEAVMPLTWRKKMGIQYLYQPFLTAQLGLFGNNISRELLEKFLTAIPYKYRLWEFSLNHGNLFNLPGFGLYPRMNFVLDLSKSYLELYQQYRENIRRNIKKSVQYGLVEKKNFDIQLIMDLARQQDTGITESDAQNFINLYGLLHKNEKATTYGIFSKTGELLSSAAFFYSHNRVYYILVGNSPNGRTLGASHALVDLFIRDHAGRPLWLDFEGSDLRNLAFFYSSFGAVQEEYAAIRLNRLPWYLRWMKKADS